MKTTREFAPADRYTYDFGACSARKGWAQIDTWQDASYFGVWINPHSLSVFTYCEGDICLQECETAEEFREEVLRCIGFYTSDDTPAKIDGMCNETIIEEIKGLGLGQYLH